MMRLECSDCGQGVSFNFIMVNKEVKCNECIQNFYKIEKKKQLLMPLYQKK